MDLRTYGVGAQILRELGVRRMKLLGSPRRMPSMTGYGLEVTGFVSSRLNAFQRLRKGHPMQGADKGTAPPNAGEGLRIGIVQARFNDASPTGWPTACLAELLALGVQDTRHHPRHRARCAGSAVALKAWPTAGLRRADRAGLHHPRRDLPLRAGGQRKRRRRDRVSRWTTRSRSPTPSSRSRTRPRPGPGRRQGPRRRARGGGDGQPAGGPRVNAARPRTRPRTQGPAAAAGPPKSRAGARVNSRCRACTSGWSAGAEPRWSTPTSASRTSSTSATAPISTRC
jgi:hypothetical protein